MDPYEPTLKYEELSGTDLYKVQLSIGHLLTGWSCRDLAVRLIELVGIEAMYAEVTTAVKASNEITDQVITVLGGDPQKIDKVELDGSLIRLFEEVNFHANDSHTGGRTVADYLHPNLIVKEE